MIFTARISESAKNVLRAALATTLLVATSITQAGFISYEIRGTPTINSGAGQTEFIIDDAGDKAALGSSDIDGMTLGDIVSVKIDRLDDYTRFSTGSGPYVAPYLNFWVTDGAGNYAVVANEPSNPAFYQSLFNNGYDLSFSDLSDKVVKIWENDDKSWLPSNGVGLTFADLAGFEIKAPTVSELTSGWAGLGTGAPRELGTNMAYGVNWVFGDTFANYVSGEDGYIVANADVSAATVPEPSLVTLIALALFGLGAAHSRRTRRRVASYS